MRRRHILAGVLAAATAVAMMTATTASAQARTAKDLKLARSGHGVVVSGKTVAFTGAASKGLDGKKITLLRKVGKKGKTVAVGKATVKNGKFSAKGTAISAGKTYWRAKLVVKKVKHLSPWVRTTTYRWYYLSDLQFVDRQCSFYTGSYAVGGKNYAHSLKQEDCSTSWIQYNLSYRCRTFDASIGLDDSANSAAVVQFSVSLDGSDTDLGSKGIGRSSHVSVNTATHFRIQLNATQSASNHGEAVWGNAQLLCSGKP